MDLQIRNHGTVQATIVYHIVTTVSPEEEEACNKQALYLLEIWKTVFVELPAHVARMNDGSKDCGNVGILHSNSASCEM